MPNDPTDQLLYEMEISKYNRSLATLLKLKLCQPHYNLPRLPSYNCLVAELQRYSRTVDTTTGDGNCLFRSISKEFFGTERYHTRIQQLTVTFLDEAGDYFSRICQSVHQEDLKKRCSRMQNDYEWGSTIELLALASIFQIPLYLFCQPYVPTSTQWVWWRYNPIPASAYNRSDTVLGLLSNLTPPADYRVELCFKDGCHFDRIVHTTLHPTKQAPPLPTHEDNSALPVVVE